VKIVIFGLTISSSWGNGHATLWRGLCKNLIRLGHEITFFERDTPYYAGARDLTEIAGGKLVLFASWADIEKAARNELLEADAQLSPPTVRTASMPPNSCWTRTGRNASSTISIHR